MTVGSGTAASLLLLLVVTVVFVVVVTLPGVFDRLVFVVALVTAGEVSAGAAVTEVVVDDDAEFVVSATDCPVGLQPPRATATAVKDTLQTILIAYSALLAHRDASGASAACA